jgi:hypothetical protein
MTVNKLGREAADVQGAWSPDPVEDYTRTA